jgi:hypothetical protein
MQDNPIGVFPGFPMDLTNVAGSAIVVQDEQSYTLISGSGMANTRPDLKFRGRRA